MKITHKKKLGKKVASAILGALMVVSIPMVAGAKDIDVPTKPNTGCQYDASVVKSATGTTSDVAGCSESFLKSYFSINADMISVKTEAQLKSALAKSGNKKIRLLANITPRNKLSVNGKNIIYLNGYKLNSLAKVKGNAKNVNFYSYVEKESDFTKALSFNNSNYPQRIILRKDISLSNKQYNVKYAKTQIYLNKHNVNIKEGGQIYINNNYVEIAGNDDSKKTLKSVGNTSSGSKSLIEIAPNKSNIYLRHFNVVASDFYDNAIKMGGKDNSITLLNMDITSYKSGSTAVNLCGTSGNAISNVKVNSINIKSNGYGLKGNYVSKFTINGDDKGTRKKYDTQKNSINFTNSGYLKLGSRNKVDFYVCTKSAKENGVYFSNVKNSHVQSITTAVTSGRYGLVINNSKNIYVPKQFANCDNNDDSTVSINNSDVITIYGNVKNKKAKNLQKFNCVSSSNITLNSVSIDSCSITGNTSKLLFRNVKFNKNLSITGTNSTSKINQFFFDGTTEIKNGFSFTNVTQFESKKDVKLTGGTGKVTNGSYFTLTNMMNTVKSKFVLSNCSKYTPTTLLR